MAFTVKKCKVLTLEEDRVKVIRLLESGKSSRILAEQFGVGRTQIQQTLKSKAELLSDYENNADLDSKRQRRATGNEDIKELTWRWFRMLQPVVPYSLCLSFRGKPKCLLKVLQL